MTKPANTEAIENETGKSWEHWVSYLDAQDARQLPHSDIASLLRGAGVPGWWAQSITVAYEQHIGRRQPGQNSDGTFTASASKTYNGTMREAYDAWKRLVGGTKEFDGVPFADEPSASLTDRGCYWRVNLTDGTKVTVGTMQKMPGKATIGMEHAKLQTAEQAEARKVFWKDFLTDLQ